MKARWDVLEFLARVVDHIPEPSQQMVRYWGFYANAARGKRRQAEQAGNTTLDIEPATLRSLPRLTRHGKVLVGDVRWFLRLLRDDQELYSMAERLLGMYREWCGSQSAPDSRNDDSWGFHEFHR